MLNHGCILRAVLLLATVLSAVAYGDENALLEKSRQITVDYATQLQTSLQQAMAAGGPVNAIHVCKDVAPRVASELSRDTGARVRRTSMGYRNPDNAPDAWEALALEKLAETGKTELFDPNASGGPRYMKAIPTGAVCIACHGESIAAEILAELDEAYPDDRARGFAIGDLRGAFSVAWPDDSKNE